MFQFPLNHQGQKLMKQMTNAIAISKPNTSCDDGQLEPDNVVALD